MSGLWPVSRTCDLESACGLDSALGISGSEGVRAFVLREGLSYAQNDRICLSRELDIFAGLNWLIILGPFHGWG